MHRNWYAVLTADVLYDKNLTSRQKLLVAVVANLSNEKGYCFASNDYLAELLNCGVRSLQRDLEALEGKYLGRVLQVDKNGKTTSRALTPVSNMTPPRVTGDTPPRVKYDTHNNKEYNNKVNISKGAPNFEEFKEYGLAKSKEYNLKVTELALKMKYDAWKEANWVNGNGKKISNWKSSLTNTLKYLAEKEKYSAQKEKELNPLDKVRMLNEARRKGLISFGDE